MEASEMTSVNGDGPFKCTYMKYGQAVNISYMHVSSEQAGNQEVKE